MNPTLYKVLDVDGTPYHGGSDKWTLPQANEPGGWMPPIEGKLVSCDRGYHLCREEDLILWLGPTIYEAEGRGEHVVCDDKIVWREARLLRRCTSWNERTARLFACDCTERVLPIYEHAVPGELRLRVAIETARRYAGGLATQEELSAARAAARDAREAAWDAWAAWAAWAAARAAGAARAAWAAAWAAREAAWAAAWAAREAAGAAGEAERSWQTDRLFEYLREKEQADASN